MPNETLSKFIVLYERVNLKEQKPEELTEFLETQLEIPDQLRVLKFSIEFEALKKKYV